VKLHVHSPAASRRVCIIPALILLVCVVSATAGYGCAPRAPSAEDKTQIRFSFWGSFLELKLWHELKALYEKRYPDTSLILEYSPGEYHRKLRLHFIAGTAADIVMVDDEYYPTYAESGNLESLEGYIARDRDEVHLGDFLPTSLESFTHRGKRFALPWDGFSVVMLYNCDLFDRAGLSYPEDDWTWDDFRRIAIDLTKDLDGDGRIDQFGCNIGLDWVGVQPLVWSYGGRLLTQDKQRFAMNSPEAIAAIEYLYDLKFKHHAIPHYGELTGMWPETQLLTGRIAMLPAAAYAMTIMRDVEGMRWDIAHMPSGPAGKATRVSWDGLAIYSGSQHKEAAWRFIKTVLSDEGQRTVGRFQRALPVRRPAVLESYVDPETPQEEEKYLEAMEYGRLAPITVKYNEMLLAMQAPMERLSLGRADVVTTVRELEPTINAILADINPQNRETRIARDEADK
jgi:multiple sugar transport system substrate-binding protein